MRPAARSVQLSTPESGSLAGWLVGPVQPVGVGAGARDQADGSISRQSKDVSRLSWVGPGSSTRTKR